MSSDSLSIIRDNATTELKPPRQTPKAYQAPFWLRGGHSQTIFPFLTRSSHIMPAFRERITLPDGDFIDLDWSANHLTSKTPIIILVHGFTGSSTSKYMQTMKQALVELNFRVVAMNLRGCSGEPNRLAKAYHSGKTEDFHFILQELQKREPQTLFGAIGYSLGANLLLKWMAEQNEHQDPRSLFACAAISPPFDLLESVETLSSGFARIYQVNLMKTLRQQFIEKMQWFQKTGNQQAIDRLNDLGSIDQIQSIFEFDDRFTAPLHGFKNAEQYYQKSSCKQYLHKITTDTLILHAVNDPFLPSTAIPSSDQLSPHVHLELSDDGGHVGFVQGIHPLKTFDWLATRVPYYLFYKLKG